MDRLLILVFVLIAIVIVASTIVFVLGDLFFAYGDNSMYGKIEFPVKLVLEKDN